MLLDTKKLGTVIADTTVQHITRYDMIDDETAAQVEDFNTDINERLDDTKFRIQHGEGGLTLEDDYDLQQWDPDYRYNEHIAEEYDACSGSTPLADAEDINDDQYNKYIGAKLVINDKSKNGENLATVIRQATDEYGAQIGQAY